MAAEHSSPPNSGKTAWTALPLLAPFVLGIISGALAILVGAARLDERVSHLERVQQELTTKINNLTMLEQQLDGRVTKTEVNVEYVVKRLDEIGADIKKLLAQGIRP